MPQVMRHDIFRPEIHAHRMRKNFGGEAGPGATSAQLPANIDKCTRRGARVESTDLAATTWPDSPSTDCAEPGHGGRAPAGRAPATRKMTFDWAASLVRAIST